MAPSGKSRICIQRSRLLSESSRHCYVTDRTQQRHVLRLVRIPRIDWLATLDLNLCICGPGMDR